MVLLSGAGGQLAGERVCPAPGSGKELPEAESGPEQGAEGAAGQGQGDEEEEGEEEEEEEDCEEYEDFSELPDTCSIASDDSFYPPGGLEDEAEDGWSLQQGDGDSPEALSLFRACCTNNAVVLRALIRQGPEEEEVRETDRNRRVSSPARPGDGIWGARGGAARVLGPQPRGVTMRCGGAEIPHRQGGQPAGGRGCPFGISPLGPKLPFRHPVPPLVTSRIWKTAPSLPSPFCFVFISLQLS